MPFPRTTHTYVIMKVNPDSYAEIRLKLEKADYHHAIHDTNGEDGVVLDMHGIALAAEPGDPSKLNKARQLVDKWFNSLPEPYVPAMDELQQLYSLLDLDE